MLKKLFILLFLFNSILFSATFKQDDFLQIVAKSLNTDNNIVHANGNVVVYSPTFYITAGKLIYNKTTSKLELFDDVNLIRNNDLITFSQYLFIDMKEELKTLKPLILIDNTSKLWFNSTQGTTKKDQYNLDSSTLSSCDCKDPAWSVSFSSGDYNTTKKWVNTYNTRLYLNNIPIFYTPYFGFPTDTTRRTGLLRPTVGYSRYEGFLYAQPAYYAPKDNYDFEYIPQYRKIRGSGHALKYRYKDSRYSMLKVEAGQFNEKKEYQDKYSLVNNKHFGWDLEYIRTKLFSNNNSSDGLLLKSLDMNDVDYINTKYDNDTSDYTNKFLESKLKYFYSTNKYYSDIDVKLYNDISKKNNDDVMQNIPTINFHQYSNSLFHNSLTSSVDISSSRKDRIEGLAADTTTLYIPLNYNTKVFDDYLNLNFTEQISYTNIKYTNNENDYQDAHYGTNNHVASLSTDLIKGYENYLHTLSIKSTYTSPDSFKEEGDIYGVNTNDTNLAIFPLTKTKKNISLGLNQSVYNKNTLKQIINHKINQIFNYNEDTNQYEKSNLENDLSIFYQYGSVQNRSLYNYESKKVVSSSSTFKFLNDGYFLNTYYTSQYEKDSLGKYTNETAEDIKYDLGVKFYKYYSASYSDEYDLTNNISKKKQYLFKIDKKCWALDFKLVDSLVSTNTTNGDILRQDVLYVQVNLKQLLKIDKRFTFKEKGE